MNRLIARRCQIEGTDKNANKEIQGDEKVTIRHNPWDKKQVGLFGADLSRKRAGKKTRTGMSEGQLTKALHEGVKKNK